MKLDKAIEILGLIEKGETSINEQDWIDATKLGIEALKWRLACEKYDPVLKGMPLPGETED